MRDPYDVLGLKRDATIEEIKAAYRRLSKERHPDFGGTNEAMSELNVAYHAILDGLKQQYQEEEAREERERKAHAAEEEWRNVDEDAGTSGRRDKRWRDRYREIDEELETLRRYAEEQNEQLRRMREAAWRTGQQFDWAKLTLEDLSRFVTGVARSGVKGVALLFAALIGIGSVLVEANVVSALIMVGSALGFLFSLAVKNDKGGFMSAALLLFGVMTIWLPPVRAAIFAFPFATLSVLIVLALIFKFAQAGGRVGLMTGGVLSIYVLFVILSSTLQQPEVAVLAPPVSPRPAPVPTSPSFQPPRYTPAPTPTIVATPSPVEPMTLLASDSAILKFAAGIPYRLKVRANRVTSLRATEGTIRADAGNDASEGCVDSLHFLRIPERGPWREIDATIRACGGDALMTVSSKN